MNKINGKVSPVNGKVNGYANEAFDKEELGGEVAPTTNSHKIWVSQVVTVQPEEDELCGWKFWKPAFLQQMRTPKVALFWLCWAASVQGMVVNGFVNVSISTIEKRYHLKSANTGLIAGFYDVASVLCAIPVSYFGSRPGASKPRWLGWGVLIMGLGSFVFTIPHFSAPPYDPVNTNNNANINDTFRLCHEQETSSPDTCINEGDQWMSSMKHVFGLGSILHGVGATPLYTLGISYLDESVPMKMSALYIGIYQTMAVIGPSFGYVIGGQFLNVFIDSPYANVEKLGISKEGSLWLGAWWVGFLISGTLAVCVSWLILALPGELPGSKARKIERTVNGSANPVTYNFGDIKALPKATKSLLHNLPYVMITLAETAEGFMMSGFAAFLPKIIESQFTVSPAVAAMLIGIVAVPAGGGGTFLGGWLVKKFNLRSDGLLKMCFAFSAICCIICSTLFISCPNNPFAGVNVPYQRNSTLDFDLNKFELPSSCNTNCACADLAFDPVCGADDTLYFSPCHAGCKISNEFDGKMIFTDCQCINNEKFSNILDDFSDHLSQTELKSSANRQPCTSKCNLMPVFLVVVFLTMLCIFLVLIPSLSATLRLVPDSHRSLALGFQWIVIRVLGTIPGPIIFGIIVDKTCILWQTTCDSSGSCRSYDNEIMGRAVVSLGLGLRIATTVFYGISFWLHRKK